LEKCPLAIRHH